MREKTADLQVKLQMRQSTIDRLSKQLEEANRSLSTIDADKFIQKKLEKDAEANARLIDELNSESIFN